MVQGATWSQGKKAKSNTEGQYPPLVSKGAQAQTPAYTYVPTTLTILTYTARAQNTKLKKEHDLSDEQVRYGM